MSGPVQGYAFLRRMPPKQPPAPRVRTPRRVASASLAVPLQHEQPSSRRRARPRHRARGFGCQRERGTKPRAHPSAIEHRETWRGGRGEGLDHQLPARRHQPGRVADEALERVIAKKMGATAVEHQLERTVHGESVMSSSTHTTADVASRSRASATAPWLDGQAARWQHARSEACMDAHLHQLWNEDTLDRSPWCLDERRVPSTFIPPTSTFFVSASTSTSRSGAARRLGCDLPTGPPSRTKRSGQKPMVRAVEARDGPALHGLGGSTSHNVRLQCGANRAVAGTQPLRACDSLRVCTQPPARGARRQAQHRHRSRREGRVGSRRRRWGVVRGR